MKISKWTEDEILYLKENDSFKSNKELANILGKSCSALSSKKRSFGLKKEKSIRTENKSITCEHDIPNIR